MKKYLLVSISLVMLLFSSCGKRTESKLVGEWRVVSVGDCDWNENATWTFYSGGEISIYGDRNVGGDVTQNGTWEIYTRSLITSYVNIDGYSTYGLNGHWRVEKVNSNKLILNRTEWADGSTTAAFMRREFVKK